MDQRRADGDRVRVRLHGQLRERAGAAAAQDAQLLQPAADRALRLRHRLHPFQRAQQRAGARGQERRAGGNQPGKQADG